MSLLPRPQMPRSPMLGGQYAIQPSGGMNFSGYGAADISTLDPEIIRQLLGEDMKFGEDTLVEGSGDSASFTIRQDPVWMLPEQQRYVQMGVADPRYKAAITNDNWKKTADPIDDLIASNPGLLGQINFRSIEGTTPDSDWFKDPNSYWSAQLGDDSRLSAAQKQVGAKWRGEMSPGAQSQRNDPDDDFLGGLGQLLPYAMYLIPGFQALAPALQGALIGGSGALLSGGNPLKGAALGGLGGWAGGAIGGSEFAQANPMLGKAASAGVRGLISSGGNVESALGSALTGGISAGISPHLGDFGWAASPLASVASAAIRGKPITPQSIALSAAGNLIKSTNAPRQATIKGVK